MSAAMADRFDSLIASNAAEGLLVLLVDLLHDARVLLEHRQHIVHSLDGHVVHVHHEDQLSAA